jgi:hypothetical protein
MLFRINPTLTMFENYSISIGPFIDTPFNRFTNLKHLSLHNYSLNTITRPMFCQTLQILVFNSNPNPLAIFHP